MDEQQGGFASESPADSGSTSTVPAPSAPVTDGAPQQQPQGPPQTVPYSRLQEVIQARNRVQQELAQVRQQQAEWQRQRQAAQQQRPQGPAVTLSPEEHAAGQAIARLMQHHPELMGYNRMASAFPQLAQGYGQINQLNQRHQDSYVASGQAQVAGMIKEAGLPVTDQTRAHYEGLVAERIKSIPGGLERWQRGDQSVLREAWTDVQQFLTTLRQPAQQALAATKANTLRLPPPPRGTTAGAPLPAPVGNSAQEIRSAERDMHAQAMRVIAGGTTR